MSGFDKRIIIGGLPRAGTTLFRYILDASPNIICGPETAFFTRTLSAHQSRADRAAQRTDRALEIGTKVIERAILGSRSLFDAYDQMMIVYCAKAGTRKSVWAEKTPQNCSMYHALALEQSDAYFVSLIRDGRDVLTSVIDGRPDYHVSVQRYVEAMRFVHAFEHPRHIIVRYEDMVADAAACFRRVFDFLGMEYTPQMLEHYRRASVTRDASKVNQPKVAQAVSTEWIGRWQAPAHRARVAEIKADPRVAEWLAKAGYE